MFLRIFKTNAEVMAYNKKILKGHRDTITSVAIDKYDGSNDKRKLQNFRTEVHKMIPIQTSGIPYMLLLLIDSPYMITSNIDVADGLVNGVIGKLKYIEKNDTGHIVRLWLKFEKSSTGKLLRSKYLKFVSENLKTDKDCVPILKRSAYINSKDKPLICKRIHFSLVEACASTIHKAQGDTYHGIVYEYDEGHAQDLVYVALSRVTGILGLYITNKN